MSTEKIKPIVLDRLDLLHPNSQPPDQLSSTVVRQTHCDVIIGQSVASDRNLAWVFLIRHKTLSDSVKSQPACSHSNCTFCPPCRATVSVKGSGSPDRILPMASVLDVRSLVSNSLSSRVSASFFSSDRTLSREITRNWLSLASERVDVLGSSPGNQKTKG